MKENRNPRSGRHAGWRTRGTKSTKTAAKTCAARSSWKDESTIGLAKKLELSQDSVATYADPEHLHFSPQTRECVPHARRETACGDGADAKQVQAVVDIMDCVGMVR